MNWVLLACWSFISVTATLMLGFVLQTFPRIRAAVCMAGLLACLLPFAPSLPTRTVVTEDRSTAATVRSDTNTANRGTENPSGQHSVAPGETRDWNPWIGLAWCLGAAFFGVRLILDVRSMNRVRSVDAPMVAGFPKARVLVPDRWPAEMSEAEIEAALAHEDAHVRGRHIAIRVAASALAGWLWWTPAWLLLRLLDDSLEDIADSKAMESVPDGLATGLLKIASLDKPAHLCMGATSAGKRLERRIRRIKRKATMERPFIAALGAIALVSTGFAVAPRLGAVSGNFGLAPGAKWTYRKTSGDGTQETLRRSVEQVLPKGDETMFEVKEVSDTGAMELTYPGLSNKDGLYVRPGRGMNGNGPGFFEDQMTVIVPAAAKVGTKWSYLLPFRGQTLGDVDVASLATNVRAEVIAVDKVVAVPAGTFKTIHVRETYQQNRAGSHPWSSDIWYSSSVGLVKRLDGQMDRSGATMTVLTKYDAGSR